jgi:LuxR family maltose regulon positive regulatory protein
VVVETKLFAPTAHTSTVARPRLEARLHAGLSTPATVVVAPAGWGKTSLVTNWLRTEPVRAGWVSLDRADNDATRFWRYLLLAAGRTSDGVGHGALRRLESAGTDIERDVLPVFVNELAQSLGPVVVVLDDYHVIANSAVHECVSTLLDRAPGELHVLISTRTDPPLALSRRRVSGQLVELRAEQLRFTVEEAGQMLELATGFALEAQDLDRLVARTEGWAAGLQLAALRLSDRPDELSRRDFIERFTGADRHVVDYLGEEVLATQPQETREFLLRTSILDRICVPLANAVTGRNDAGQLLEEVFRANLFLTPCDDEHRWFRYHHLFRGILQHELARTDPIAAPSLHRRAAIWFRDAGESAEAVTHALRSDDDKFAGSLIAEAWRDVFNKGQLHTVQSWLDVLSPETVAADVRLSVARVWLALDSGQLHGADSALRTAERHSPSDPHVHVLRALHTFKIGDVGGAAQMLNGIRGSLTDPFVLTVSDLLTGVCALWLGDAARARVALEASTRTATRMQNGLARVYTLGCRAVLAVECGDLGNARTLVSAGETQVDEDHSDAHFVAMFPALARARLSAATGEWVPARSAAERAVELARRGAGQVELAAALLTLARSCRSLEIDTRPYLVEARGLIERSVDAGALLGDWYTTEQRAERVDRTATLEPLTERERAILRLLPQPITQRELADALFVTPNTLKTHLRAIYRKLGADSRNDAVLRAQAAGLL